jgi:hypothetical protein
MEQNWLSDLYADGIKMLGSRQHHHHHFHCNTTHAGNMSYSTFCEPKIVDTQQENAHFI